jgi:FkbM family methyltransferase
VTIVRHTLERLTRRLIFQRRLPAAFGNAVLYVSPAAGLRFLFSSMASIDPPLLMAAHKLVRAGDVIWDIGANIGLFSLAAAVCAGDRGEVIAFEPDVWLVQLLRRTSAVQPAAHARITVVPAAVASEISLRRFAIALRSRASNALVGYGSTQLNEVRPVIICEVGSQTADEITGVLTSASYCLFDGEKPLDKAQIVDRATWSTIAIPEEKASAAWTFAENPRK